MSTRDYAVSVLASLSEQKMIEFIKLFADDNTIARMESDMLAHDINRKHYDSFTDILKEIDEDTNND